MGNGDLKCQYLGRVHRTELDIPNLYIYKCNVSGTAFRLAYTMNACDEILVKWSNQNAVFCNPLFSKYCDFIYKGRQINYTQPKSIVSPNDLKSAREKLKIDITKIRILIRQILEYKKSFSIEYVMNRNGWVTSVTVTEKKSHKLKLQIDNNSQGDTKISSPDLDATVLFARDDPEKNEFISFLLQTQKKGRRR